MESQPEPEPDEPEDELTPSSRTQKNLNPGEYPEDGTIQDRARFVINYAIRAPSVENTQTCSFKFDESTLRISVPSNPSIDQRESHFNLGCVLENFTVAANQFKLAHRVSYIPDGWSASVSIDLDPEWTFSSESSPRQFTQLTEERICADQLEDRSLPHDLVKQIREMTCEDVVNLELITDTGIISKFVNLHEQLTNTNEKKKRSNEQPPDEKNKKQHKETGFWNRILSFIRSLFSSADEPEEKDQEQEDIEAYEAPSYLPPAVVLSGWTDGPVSWIKCGRVFQRITLMTGNKEVVVQPLHQVMAHPEARKTVQKLINTPEHTVPHFLFRLGYGETREQTSRLDVEDVLEE